MEFHCMWLAAVRGLRQAQAERGLGTSLRCLGGNGAVVASLHTLFRASLSGMTEHTASIPEALPLPQATRQGHTPPIKGLQVHGQVSHLAAQGDTFIAQGDTIALFGPEHCSTCSTFPAAPMLRPPRQPLNDIPPKQGLIHKRERSEFKAERPPAAWAACLPVSEESQGSGRDRPRWRPKKTV